MELTREEAIRNFREHWASLAISGSSDKEEYLQRHGFKSIKFACFLCDYTKGTGCKNCPVEWPKTNDKHHHATPCTQSYFGDWADAEKPEERSRLAALIRDLPEKKEAPNPTPRFSVGQKVVPVSKSTGNPWGFVFDDMCEPCTQFFNKEGYLYVKAVNSGHINLFHDLKSDAPGYTFLESDLRPYVEPEKEPEPKPAAFKVGDRVRVIEELGYASLDAIGIVVKPSSGGVWAEFNKMIKNSPAWDMTYPSKKGKGCWMPFEAIELLPSINLCPENKTVTLETVTVTFNGNKTTCIIENELGRFKGCAKCSPDDAWDEQTGVELAKVRAYRKMLEVEERNIRMI